MNIPKKTFSISLQGNTYETRIKQAKMVDLELNKLILTKGFYNSIVDGQVLDLIDYASALYAFFPKVKEDAKIDIMELDPVDIKEIADQMKPFYKWYFEWKKFMGGVEKEEEIKEEK